MGLGPGGQAVANREVAVFFHIADDRLVDGQTEAAHEPLRWVVVRP